MFSVTVNVTRKKQKVDSRKNKNNKKIAKITL